jgi:diaminohydroxyphosphoribosylaminopyrimidine deaminase/5-amino-6-(5-phosphoribosylamino)uracil reductase
MTPDAAARPASTAEDQQWMRRALTLAERGWGRVFPNPLVGAVVVRNGELVGEGWHAEFGGPHAEAVALAMAGDRARGATLYVTLEPCAHHGKQPPCTDAVLAAGIARVVVASTDPNPVAAGGITRLEASRIPVQVGVEAAEERFLNVRFHHLHARPERPWVAAKLAVSMDGCIADSAGSSRWLSGSAARDWVHHLRGGFGAVGVGAATAIADDARLTVRGGVTPRLEPARVLFDRSGRLTGREGIFHDAASVPVFVVTGLDAATQHGAAIEQAGGKVLVARDLRESLLALARVGIDSLVVEGGGRLAGALLEADLLDRIYQVQCPLWLGDGIRAWQGLGSPAITSARRWRVNRYSMLSSEGDALLVLEP